MPPAKNPGGRPRAEEGQPPFPKVWKDTERLAGVLAYLEASEKGPNANREGDAKKAYADQLDFVITEVKDFEVSKHKWGGGHGPYLYTAAESKKRRPSHTATCMVDNFALTRKVCNNHISPVYYRLHDNHGTPPSGSNREKLIKSMMDELLPDQCDLTSSPAASAPNAPVHVDAEDAGAGTLILYNLSTVLNTRPAWHISNKAATLSSTGFENGPRIPSP